MNGETRAVVEAVLEALDIPSAATIGFERTRNEILLDRVMHTVITLQFMLWDADDPPFSRLDPMRQLVYLRERLAEHPPVGYITWQQALERRKQGADYMESVIYGPLQPASQQAAAPGPDEGRPA